MVFKSSKREAAPASSKLQREISLKGKYPPVPKKCVVTGGTGFVGLRLVEMLIERGAEKVVSFDVVGIEDLPEPVRETLWKNPKIVYMKGDVTKLPDLLEAFEGADCVWHIAAAVGPFHPKHVYEKVNFEGTKNVWAACKQNVVKKIVMASTPSTRMNGSDIDGLTEAQLPSFEQMQGKFLQPYAESKFKGEKFLTEKCSDDLLTIAVAPHQVYGPRDNLFMPNFIDVLESGTLRMFSKKSTGYGKSKVCFTHVDNYCHGLILAEHALTKTSDCRAKFYIVTDAQTHPDPRGFAYIWDELDNLGKSLGFGSLKDRTPIPYWFIMPVAQISSLISKVFNLQLKLSPFTVTMMTMHRWYDVSAAKKDLKYEPIVSFREGWNDTVDWFREYWLPKSNTKNSLLGQVAKTTKGKIDIQTASVDRK